MIGIRKGLLALGVAMGVLAAAPSMAVAQDASVAPQKGGNLLLDAVGGVKSPTDALRASRQNVFVRNDGQWDERALFRAGRPGMTYWITEQGIRLDVFVNQDTQRVGQVVDMKFTGAVSGAPVARGVGEPAHKTDYLYYRGKNHVGVPSFKEAQITNLGRGMDARYYFDGSEPRYDLILKPGADPAGASIVFEGASGIEVDSAGDVLIRTSIRTVRQAGLKVYQTVNGRKSVVSARFRVTGKNSVGIDLGSYDRNLPLVIDPVVYGTYVGGDFGSDEVRDSISNNNGQVYITGSTESDFFPITTGIYSLNRADLNDAFVVALTGDAYDVSYAAYLGGLRNDVGKFLQVDQYGNLWLAGESSFGFKGAPFQIVQAGVYEGPPTGGNFVMSFGGEFTQAIDFDATDAEIQAELNTLGSAPAGGFLVTGGQLPDDRLVITLASGENLAEPVVIHCPTKPYSIVDDGLGNLGVGWVAGTDNSVDAGNFYGDFGLKPNGGLFRFSITRNGTVTKSRWMAWNASDAAIRAAFTQAPVSLPGDKVNVDPGNLPDDIVTFQINPDQNVQRIAIETRDANQTDRSVFASDFTAPTRLLGGYYTGYTDERSLEIDDTGAGFSFAAYPSTNTPNSRLLDHRAIYPDLSSQSRVFLMRFEAKSAGQLDPLTTEVVKYVDGKDSFATGLSSMLVRPFPSAAGQVQITVLGNTLGPIDLMTAASLPRQAGYFTQFTYTNGANTVAVDQPRSQYIAGSLASVLAGAAMDSNGGLYVTGSVLATQNVSTGPASTTFATTTGVFTNGNLIRFRDAFVRKYDTTGLLVYSAVLGGSGTDDGCAIAVDALGNAYVAGIARSFNFPRTASAFGQIFSANRVVTVTKINPNASQLVYSTNLQTSGSVQPRTIAVDSRGNAYIGGVVGMDYGSGQTMPITITQGTIRTTPVGPVVPNQTAADDPTYSNGTGAVAAALQMKHHFFDATMGTEGFLSVLNSGATGLLYGSYLGMDRNEDVFSVRVDATDGVFVGGKYESGGYHLMDLTNLNFFSVFSGYSLSYGTEAGMGSVVTANNPENRVFTTFADVRWPGLQGNPAVLNTHPGQANLPNRAVAGQSIGLPNGFITNLGFKTNEDLSGDGFLVKLRIALPALADLTLTPDLIAGGRGAVSNGAVFLQNPAPAGGTQVTVRVLQPSVARLSVGGATSIRITIPQGQSVGTFQVFSRPVTVPSSCDVRAELNGDFLVRRLNVRPWLDSFTLSSNELPGGNTLQGTVTLFQVAPTGGITINLSSDSTLVSLPATITVPEGQQSVTFNIDTQGVAAPTDVNLSASLDGIGFGQALRLLPATVVGLSFSPGTVNGGESSVGTVFLDGKAAAGMSITLSQAGAPVTIPATIPLTAGATQATFTVGTSAVTGTSIAASITASLSGTSVTQSLIIEGNNIVSITLSSNSVLGGASVTGTVTLARPASPSGITIPLLNSNTTAGTVTPASVFISPGDVTGTFTINTFGVSTTQNLIVTANKPGYATPSATLQVRALSFGLVISPNVVTGGSTTTGTITLAGVEVAPDGGLTINLSSNNSAILVPTSVVIPAGTNTASFTITTNRVGGDVVGTVSATAGTGFTAQANLTVRAPELLSVTVAPTSPIGGSTATGTVTLGAAAPTGGLVVNLSSSNSAASVPATVTVASGATTANFTVTTLPVSAPVAVTITATNGSQSKSTQITVSVSTIASLTFNPSIVKGGLTSTATLTLTQFAPAGGLIIDLSADKPGFVSMPASVTVPAGTKTITFNVGTAQVTRLVGVVITATVRSTNTKITSTLYIERNLN
ncbi:MAG: hypothetical protein JNM85_03300 [Chthonomonas sp.]|nr:hypothetical protein [Chthonomonas sp.]